MQDIAAINGISWIEEYIKHEISNDVAATIVNAPAIRESYELFGTGQIVAVCDTGIDTGVNDDSMHADIRGRILNITDYSDNGPADDGSGGGHGTHVTGSVLGNGSLSGGQYAGTAPEATLVFQAVQDADNSLGGIDDLPDISVLFLDAYEHGARIHTNSWGSYAQGAYTIDSQQVDQFMWDYPDMLILFAAGNAGMDLDADGVIDKDAIDSPATSKNCVAVGATENYRPGVTVNTYGTYYPAYYSANPVKDDNPADNDKGMAAFSSRGPTDDGRIKPDVVAPGTFIYSTKSSMVFGTANYTYMSGTSMATPITAGSAAVVRQYYTDIENISNPSSALLKATLINGAYNLTPGQYGTGSTQEINGRYDDAQGWGRIDLENSIYPQYPDVIKYYDKIPMETDDSWDVSFDVAEDSENLRATLVWTDYPGDTAASIQLVNNLDLIVAAPEDTYYGNIGTDDTRDSLNNVEGVELISPTGGTYTFTVEGTNVPQGPQNFSLVISFTEDINEYPENNTYTNDNSTLVSVDLLHPHGINVSSINMTVDGIQVNHSLEAIDDGFTVTNATAQPYSEGQHNASVLALTNLSQEIIFEWVFYEDYGAPSITDLTNSSTSSSVTLQWNESSDTDHVEIWLDEDFLINSSSSGLTDTGLSSSTDYNYSLKPIDIAGNIGNWTNTTVSTSSSPGGGGGGGGGGGSTGEEYENIRFKDVLCLYKER
ncbi:MAG: S8 family serine peptidase [Methanolobus sp.]